MWRRAQRQLVQFTTAAAAAARLHGTHLVHDQQGPVSHCNIIVSLDAKGNGCESQNAGCNLHAC